MAWLAALPAWAVKALALGLGLALAGLIGLGAWAVFKRVARNQPLE